MTTSTVEIRIEAWRQDVYKASEEGNPGRWKALYRGSCSIILKRRRVLEAEGEEEDDGDNHSRPTKKQKMSPQSATGIDTSATSNPEQESNTDSERDEICTVLDDSAISPLDSVSRRGRPRLKITLPARMSPTMIERPSERPLSNGTGHGQFKQVFTKSTLKMKNSANTRKNKDTGKERSALSKAIRPRSMKIQNKRTATSRDGKKSNSKPQPPLVPNAVEGTMTLSSGSTTLLSS